MSDETNTPDDQGEAQNDEVRAAPQGDQDEPGENEAGSSKSSETGGKDGSAQDSAARPADPVGRSDVNLDALLNVPVSLSIEVGRKKMRLDDLLETQEGSVVELDKLLNEPLDILVNGALIAHGVIVLAEERFGIQITDILSPEERARSL